VAGAVGLPVAVVIDAVADLFRVADDTYAGIRRNPVPANPLDANLHARTVDVLGANRPGVALTAVLQHPQPQQE
jgi:hypothetical protein